MSAISIQSLKDQARNFRLLYLDSFMGTIPGIAGAFAGAFAIRMGATNTEIGLLNSIPSLLAIFVSIPFGRIVQNTSRKMFWTAGGITIYRIGFMLLVLAPWMNASFLTPGFIL